MSSYTPEELTTLSYIVSFFDSSDYKFLASLLKKEYGLHSESAYVSRMYILRKSGLQWNDQVEKYNTLDVTNRMLKAVLKPEEEEKSEDSTTSEISVHTEQKVVNEQSFANLDAAFCFYKMKTRDNFKRMKNILQTQNDRVKELELKLEKQEMDAGVVYERLQLLKARIDNTRFKPRLERHNVVISDIVIRDPEEEEEIGKVTFDESLNEYFKTMREEMEPKSIVEWKKNPLKNNPTYPVYVKSEKEDDNKYKVRYLKKSNSYHCECLAWKYQEIDPCLRSCKHINAVFGKDNISKWVNEKKKN